MAVYFAALEPGDTILAMRLDHGGHLTHGHKVNFSGHLYSVVSYGVEREIRPDRLRGGQAACARAQAEADRVRRVCLPARDRGGQVPRSRRRGRGAAPLRHGALLRARCGRRASEPRTALRLRDVDDAQDPGRAARRVHPLPGGAREGRRPGGLPGDAGRAALPHDRRQGDVLQDRGLRAVPGLPGAGSGECRCARRGARSRAGSSCSPAAPTRIWSSWTSVASEWTGKDAEDRLHDVWDHREPQHRSVRRAPADRRIGRAARLSGGDDARLRRGRHARGRPTSSRAFSPRTPTFRRLRSRTGALCARHPLYPGFRGFPAYAS